MKKMHLPLGTVGLALLLSANTCNTGSTGATASGTDLTGTWVLTELNGAAAEMPEGKEQPYLSFDSLAQNVNGYAGCNRVFGPVHLNGDSIGFTGLAATRMYCTETQYVEDAFMAALNRTNTYTVKEGRLSFYAGGQQLAVLSRKEK